MIKYIYTMPFCSECIKLKKKYKEEGIDFIERDGSRLKNIPIDVDDIDRQAMVVLSMQNLTFPVEVEVQDDNLDKRV